MSEPRCVLDYETRSARRLGNKGTNAHNYAMHASSDVWLGRFAFTDDPDTIHRVSFGQPIPQVLRDFVGDGGIVVAHNAGFEYAIWNHLLRPRYGWPHLPIEQMDDTAARAARCGLPRSLEKAAPAAGIAEEKDKTGNDLSKRMSRPRKVNHCDMDDEQTLRLWRSFARMSPMTYTLLAPDPDGDGSTAVFYTWWNEPDRVERLDVYCEQDVRTQMALEQTLPQLSASEHRIWLSTMRANIRGCRIDMDFVRKAQVLVQRKLHTYAQELQETTGGAVKSHTDLNGMKAWMCERGLDIESLDKNVVQSLLADDTVPQEVKRVAEIRAESGKSSVAKYPAMEIHADVDGVAREQLVYYGASATGRWSASGFQVQNLPSRGEVKYKDADRYIDLINRRGETQGVIDFLESMQKGSVIETLSMCLRGAIRAREGKEICCADYSNIEGRKGAWFGGERWKLKAFRDFDAGVGPDLYKVTAGIILGKDPAEVTDTERNVLGKVPELALGFQGGVGAFISMGAVYGINMEDYYDTIRGSLPAEHWDQAVENFDTFGTTAYCSKKAWIAAEAVKLAWRDRHRGIAQSWRDMEDAAVAAVSTPGRVFKACDGKISFLCRPLFGKPFLLMRLPSGRSIYYPAVRVREAPTPWGTSKPVVTFNKVESGRVVRAKTYGGDLFQSAVQGTARDVMACGWTNVEDAGYEPLFSVHDEMASECDQGAGDLEEYESLLCDVPSWADGCPITATGYVAQRFRKD